MKNLSLYYAVFILIASLSFQSCSNTNAAPAKGTRISGQIQNAGNMKIFLDRMTFTNQSEVIQKGDMDANGSFQLDVPDGVKNGVYRVRVGGSRALLVFNGTEKNVKLTGDINSMQQGNITIDGSPDASAFLALSQKLATGQGSKDEAKAFVESTPNAVAAALMAQMFLGGDAQYVTTTANAAQKLNAALPGTDYAQDFTNYASQLSQQIAQQQAASRIAIGAPAPDINLPSPDGKNYALSSLKGKVVLLDFWASWCGPCRKSNPHVVDMYKKYNGKGFEVFNVSLDGINPRMIAQLNTPELKDQELKAAKDRWVAAIKQDNLKWPYHVSDLQHWNSAPAATYGVRSIPRTFLIDKNGNIAGDNLRGEQLEAKIKELL
jgi:thiol-disulfide isomerase/thioredoxin